MGIWVRSQDKTKLIFANQLEANGINMWAGTFATEDSDVIIGKYATEAEALQALDMIEELIASIARHPDITPIFQMPEAGFSEEEK